MNAEAWADRLFSRTVTNENGCRIWQGAVRGAGYGLAHGPDRKMRIAHRLAYELVVGAIPEGLDLDHLCRTPSCINPAHLEPVTRAENIRRAAAAQTHCKHGHEWTPETTRRTSTGHRRCLTCKRTYELAAYHARKARERAA